MYDGDLYPTSEHAYVAAKIEEREGRQSFVCGGSVGDNPMKAKQKGKSVRLRPGWDSMKDDLMLEVVRSKFQRDTVFQDALLATHDETLREEGTGDTYWGGKRNHLGNILMQVRRELRKERQLTSQLRRRDDSDDDVDDDACPKRKERSKGSVQKRSSFEETLKVYDEVDSASTDHSQLDSGSDNGFDQQSVDAAPADVHVVLALNAKAREQWIALGKEAKAASEQAAKERDAVQKCYALRAAVTKCRRAGALRPNFPMPLLTRSLAELENLESTMLKVGTQEDAQSESSTQSTSVDVAPAPTWFPVPSQIATETIQDQTCHNTSWHGWYCHACGHLVQCIDGAAHVGGQGDDVTFVDARCAKSVGRRFRPRGGRSRFSRKYDADHRWPTVELH